MHNCHNDNFLFMDRIKNGIRKTAHQPTSYCLVNFGPGLRILRYVSHRLFNNVYEILPKLTGLSFVINS